LRAAGKGTLALFSPPVDEVSLQSSLISLHSFWRGKKKFFFCRKKAGGVMKLEPNMGTTRPLLFCAPAYRFQLQRRYVHGTIEILHRSYARRSLFEKKENFLQLISTLFCEVKRGFVDC
jgi:hypothetical protein